MTSVNTRPTIKARKRAQSSSGTTSPTANTGVDDSDSGPPARKKIKTSSESGSASDFKSKATAKPKTRASNKSESFEADNIPTTDSVFFRLPRELRDDICSYIAQQEKHRVLYVNIGIQKGQRPHITATAHDGGLVGTCSQLRHEYLETLARVFGAGLVEQNVLSYGSAQITATRTAIEGLSAVEARISATNHMSGEKEALALVLTFNLIGKSAPSGTLQKLELSAPAFEKSQWYQDKIEEFYRTKADRDEVRDEAIAAAKGVQWKGLVSCYKHWYEVVKRPRPEES